MTPSMKAGLYHVYILLGKEGSFATINKLHVNVQLGKFNMDELSSLYS